MQKKKVISFPESLRAWRRSRGLTQAALAHAAGLTANAVWMLEAGLRRDPPWSSVLALANALKISPNNFLQKPLVK